MQEPKYSEVNELYDSRLKHSELAKSLKINCVMGLRNAIEFYKREEVITENATYEIAEGEQGKQIAQREKRKMKRSREKAKGKN